ncbi:MAD2L1-binding protein-like [Eublepharis macularius]|uniref:MAD2L1-binding protein-like n=1 Tax=Eublepharis macularius TaxID=481883 RepID=A0AA97L877_EUBMA|nr:MAD2L1-binding protein-like [Eublepharis macularius]XP_054846575.1 MAD2L1-binding protein-like [Eublepharis macularius]
MAVRRGKRQGSETEGDCWGPERALPLLPSPDPGPLASGVLLSAPTGDSAALSASLSAALPGVADPSPESDSVAVTVALEPLPVAPTAGGAFSVSVAFPGSVTRESCFHFACELLKHVLYQRQQLPLPYEQLVCFSRRQLPRPPHQGENVIRNVYSRDLENSKKCQQALGDLERVFQHLETMFSLTLVPRVLILLGGTAVNPKELYEINLQGISLGGTEESLQTAACVRKLFHSLFLADIFSDLQAVPTVGVIVMVQGHRNCGIDWFRPKLNYRVPARGRKLTVNLFCSDCDNAKFSSYSEVNSGLNDYIWFQAPVTVKGFRYFS